MGSEESRLTGRSRRPQLWGIFFQVKIGVRRSKLVISSTLQLAYHAGEISVHIAFAVNELHGFADVQCYVAPLDPWEIRMAVKYELMKTSGVTKIDQ